MFLLPQVPQRPYLSENWRVTLWKQTSFHFHSSLKEVSTSAVFTSSQWKEHPFFPPQAITLFFNTFTTHRGRSGRKKRIHYTGYTRELFDKKRVAITQRNGKQWHLRGKEKNLRGKKKILRGTQDDAPPKQVASYSTLPRIALPTTANLLHREREMLK